MNESKTASEILNYVGGRTNVRSLTHCFTRLRFILKDTSKADRESLERVDGVISVVEANGEYQVVCGANVEEIFNEIEKLTGNSLEEEEMHLSWNLLLQKSTEIFAPLVPAIAASGLLKGLLSAAARISLFDGFTATSTYEIITLASNVIFYFMPVFLAFSAAKALKVNQVIAMMIGAFLCHPSLDALIMNVSKQDTIFGLPVVKMAFKFGESTKIFSYTETVIPIILIVICMHFLEKFLKKTIPEILHVILLPGIEFLIMLPITLSIVGPIGIYVGYVVQLLYSALYGFSPLLGGVIIGGLWCVLVIFGAHRSLLPIGLNDVSLTGTNTLMCFAGAANFAQAGAALGVMLKSKKSDTKQVAGAGLLSAALVGVTEPAIYGVNLRFKKPMICAVIAGAMGGAVMGIGKAVNTGFANNGVLTIASYYGEGTSFSQFLAYLIGIGTSFFGAAILTYIVGFSEDGVTASKSAAENTEETEKPEEAVRTEERTTYSEAKIELASPTAGRTFDLKEVNDPVFSGGSLGNGIAIDPSNGIVIAPCDGKVSAVYPAGHAAGLTLDNGVELLIHIGTNTVELGTSYFERKINQGDHFKKGDALLTFDPEGIRAAGYEPTVICAIVNTRIYTNVEGLVGIEADTDTVVITIEK